MKIFPKRKFDDASENKMCYVLHEILGVKVSKSGAHSNPCCRAEKNITGQTVNRQQKEKLNCQLNHVRTKGE